MKNNLKRALISSAAGLVLVVPASAMVMIDDFSTGVDSQGITSGNAYFWQNGSMVGGTRGEFLNITSGNGLNFDVDVISGIIGLSKDPGVEGYGQIAYGYVPGNPYSLNDMNLDLSGESQFCITVINNDQAGTMDLSVIADGNQFQVTHALPVVGSSTDLFFDFSEFTGINFSSVDQIVLQVNTPAGGDTALDTIKAVPEPATLFALGAGAAALFGRRRRKA